MKKLYLLLALACLPLRLPAQQLYPDYPCEGRASYRIADQILQVPFVEAETGIAYEASLHLAAADPVRFSLIQFSQVWAQANPGIPTCHARLFQANGRMQAEIPFVDVAEAGWLYRVLLQRDAAGDWELRQLEPVTRARLEPLVGSYVGVDMDWGQESVEGINISFGLKLNSFGRAAQFPMVAPETEWVDQAVEQIAGGGAMMLLTLEPNGGLDSVTAEAAEALALRLQGYNALGVPVLLRFAHSMNSPWHSWGLQPAAYIRAFRQVAEAVHRLAPDSAMLWAPAYGGGYPFGNAPPAGTADFALLDTNRDGLMDSKDDPYAPYYPGDDAVDWVGMSVFHWGNQYPWDNNEIPEAGKFAAQLTGSYVGMNGDQRYLPDFYANYAQAKNKPLAIPETAALFIPALGDAAQEQEIKQAWWLQVFDPQTRERFPLLRLVHWHEFSKPEGEVGGQEVNWRISHSQSLAAAFRAALQDAGMGLFLQRE